MKVGNDLKAIVFGLREGTSRQGTGMDERGWEEEAVSGVSRWQEWTPQSWETLGTPWAMTRRISRYRLHRQLHPPCLFWVLCLRES